MKQKWFMATTLLALLGLALFGAGCGLDSGGGNDESAGTAAIRLNGGDAYAGGGAGSIYVDSYAEVSFKAGGGANASFAVPAYNWTTNLGTRGATISTDCSVLLVYYGGGGTEPEEGRLYMLVQEDWLIGSRPYLYRSNGDNVLGQGSDLVTGLRVNGGVTLTLPANYRDGGAGVQMARLDFQSDVEINGTLKTAGLDNNSTLVDGQGNLLDLPQPQRHGENALAIDKAGINLSAFRFLSNGSIVTAGGNATAAESRGGDSGRVRLSGRAGFINRGTIVANAGNGNGAQGGNACVSEGMGDTRNGVYLWNDGALVNAGAISANGGNGTSGGWAGYVYLDSLSNVFNTAAINASGGTGSAGTGGDADYVYMYSADASVMNAGPVTAKGGDGSTGGGNGAELYFVSGNDGNMGNTLNGGALNLSGGSATGTNGSGGDGGQIGYFGEGTDPGLEAQGRIANAGAITSTGGAGKGTGYGGDGGYLGIYVDYESPYRTGDYGVAGPVQFSGEINLSGGAAASTGGVSGGDGGDIDVDATSYSDYSYPVVLPVQFLGYGAGLQANGGSGNSGGNGGNYEIYTYAGWSFGDYFEPPTPSIYSDIPVSVRGGSGSRAGYAGGQGGYVQFETSDDDSYVVGNTPFPVTAVTNAGSIDARGGDATGAGGEGGYGGGLYLYGYNKATNNGSVNASGGAATGANGLGGMTYRGIAIYATYDIENNGAITMSGGNATGANGSGGSHDTGIYMSAGGTIRCNGPVASNGGNATGEGTNGVGGYINLFSGGSGTVYGSLTAAKGAGGSGGFDGQVWVDRVLLFGEDLRS